ncbi:MAG TPA: hypothetical protein VIJ26_03490 [Thermoanaerobaculia bacterium]
MELTQEILKADFRVSQRSFQSEAVDLRMIGKYDDPAVGMTHLDVAALTVDLHKAEAFESGKDLPS